MMIRFAVNMDTHKAALYGDGLLHQSDAEKDETKEQRQKRAYRVTWDNVYRMEEDMGTADNTPDAAGTADTKVAVFSHFRQGGQVLYSFPLPSCYDSTENSLHEEVEMQVAGKDRHTGGGRLQKEAALAMR